MKRLVLVSLLGGCTQNADIGITDQPVACAPSATAGAHGTLHDAAAHRDYTFGATTPRLALQPITVTLSSTVGVDEVATMRLVFLCGQPTLETYGVMPVAPQTIDCPLSVAGDAGMANFFADSSHGTLIVDQTASCLAGRFDVDYGAKGSLAGWFSVPWQ